MNPFYVRVIGSLVRSALLAIGGGHAVLSDSETEQFVGALLIVGGTIWSLIEKYRSSQALKAK